METMPRDIMTAVQAAEYLQVDRETIYRYIRQGRLVASRLGRGYRIHRRNLDRLMIANRTRSDIPLRVYDADAIAEFLERDRIDPETESSIREFERLVASDSARER